MGKQGAPTPTETFNAGVLPVNYVLMILYATSLSFADMALVFK